MYIYIEDDVCDIDFKNNVGLFTAFEHVINTGYEGLNIIDMSTSTYKKIIQNNIFGSIFIGKLKHINHYNKEYYPLYENINLKIKISITRSTIIKEDNFWIIPLGLIKYGYLSGVDLITEDNDDGRLLKHAVSHFQQLEKNLRSFPSSINVINGGGTNILDTLEQQIENQKTLIVCFCDSDKLSPYCNLGTTTSSCKKLVESNEIEKPVVFMHTFGREIENDLPHFFIEQTSSNDKNVLNNFLNLKDISDNICKEAINYSDLKFGTTTEWVKRRSNGSPAKIFWLEKIEELKENKKIRTDYDLLSSNDTEIILNPICQKMSEKILTWLDYNSKNVPKQVSKEIKNHNDSLAWLKHGEKLFWLSIGGIKGRL